VTAGAWERLATHEGGTVVALASAPTANGGTALFAATAAGLFRSDDGGRVWSPTGATPLPLMTSLAASSRFAATRLLFAGTETGFFCSTDAGGTWRETLTGARVFAIAAVSTGDEAEDVFIGTEADGILRSGDGGATWIGANAGLLDLTVLALAFSPSFARDQTGFAATASGLYRTRNGGKSWREVALPRDEVAVQCIAISPDFANDRLVLAGTEADGLLRSDDGGATWHSVPGLSDGGVSAITFAAHPGGASFIAAATAEGVTISRDGGETWAHTGGALPPVLALHCLTVGGDGVVVAGLHRDGIARRSLRGGETPWERAAAGLTATLLTQVVASSDGTVVVSGPEGEMRRSRDGGRTWERVAICDEVVSVHGLAIVSAPDGRGALFAATDRGIMRGRDAGAHWDGPLAGTDGAQLLAAAGNAFGATLFAATADGALLRSDDTGERWGSLSAPFAGAHIISLACSPEYERDRYVYVGVIQSSDAIRGGREAALWSSQDGGATWTRLLQEPDGNGVLPLAIASGRSASVFVGRAGCVMHPRPHAWETRGGVRMPLWRAAPLTAPDGGALTVTALAVSPHVERDGAVFAATSAGVYRSSDRGRTFARWADGMGPAPILAIAIAPDAGAEEGAFVVFALGVHGTIWRRAMGRD
jgi:photosystem II stability/assembly factor-like uncharacterized protein